LSDPDVPDHHDGIDAEHEGDGTSGGESALGIVGSRARTSLVSALATGVTPPSILGVVETEVLLEVSMKDLLAPATRVDDDDLLDSPVGVCDEVCAIVDSAFWVTSDDHTYDAQAGDGVPHACLCFGQNIDGPTIDVDRLGLPINRSVRCELSR